MKRNQELQNKIKINLHKDFNVWTIVKVLYTIKTHDFAVGCFELIDIYPELKTTLDFEKTIKQTINNIYGSLEIEGEIMLTELEDKELLSGDICPRDFAITIN